MRAEVIEPAAIASPVDLPRPWLSVILPIYRGETWLERTLASVAADADPGIEIVVIDSSPDDGSMAIVSRFADRLRLRIVDPAGIDGCSPKMNLGVRHASADHVAWLCQDDLWFPNRAAEIRKWIATDPGAALHLAPTAIIDRDDRRLGIWKCPLPAGAGRLDRNRLFAALLVQNFVAVPSPIVRRDVWLASGGRDLGLWYTGDWDLWLKLAGAGDVHYHDVVTAGFRIHGASATSTGSRDRGDFGEQHRIVVDRHIDRLTPATRPAVRRLADASIAINTALAAAANGQASAMLDGMLALARLGPLEAARYLNRSRLIERVLPRLRAKLAGAL